MFKIKFYQTKNNPNSPNRKFISVKLYGNNYSQEIKINYQFRKSHYSKIRFITKYDDKKMETWEGQLMHNIFQKKIITRMLGV